MATKLDREWVKAGVAASLTVAEHMNALVLEVERLEALQEKKDAALKLAKDSMSVVLATAPGYDWNADPANLTLQTGNMFAAIDAALT
jgi:hypothetical protein